MVSSEQAGDVEEPPGQDRALPAAELAPVRLFAARAPIFASFLAGAALPARYRRCHRSLLPCPRCSGPRGTAGRAEELGGHRSAHSRAGMCITSAGPESLQSPRARRWSRAGTVP